MEQREYMKLADECLLNVGKWLEGLDPDEVDYSTGDGVVTIEFPDGSRFILSRQSAAAQVWLAAGAHGWHYNWSPELATWVDDKDGHELYPRLAELVAERVGHEVEF